MRKLWNKVAVVGVIATGSVAGVSMAQDAGDTPADFPGLIQGSLDTALETLGVLPTGIIAIGGILLGALFIGRAYKWFMATVI